VNFYPYEIETASPAAAKSKLIVKHEKLIHKSSMAISLAVMEAMHFIREADMAKRVEGYARVFAQAMMHLPARRLAWAEKNLIEAALERISIDASRPPAPFLVMCDASMAVAFPGLLSYYDTLDIATEWSKAMGIKGVDRVEYTIYDMEVQLACSEQWLDWARKGFPKPDGKLDLGDGWDGWTPPPTTIKVAWEKAPEAEREKYTRSIMHYLYRGVERLKRLHHSYEQTKGKR
jgi:hypothetical protein